MEPNSVMLFAGQGPLINDVKEKVHNLSLDGSVRFLGQRNDVNELYQAFDVFVLPSLYEGLPVVGVEAQASGLLCVLSDDMTKETKIIDSTIFISLDKSPKYWATKIIQKNKNFVRKDVKDEITANNFNIKSEVERLLTKYLELNNIDERVFDNECL